MIDDLLVTIPSDDRASIENQRDRVLAGSCSWVLQEKAFADWQATDTDTSRILWLHGDPGKGKTMIAISLVDALGDKIARRSTSEQHRLFLTFFFCDNNNSSRNTVLSVLKNLLYQVLSHQPNLIGFIRKEYRSRRSWLTSSLDALWTSLCDILEKTHLKRIYYIVDALDECDFSSQEAFLRLLTIRSNSGRDVQQRKVRWLITSRNESLPQQYLARFLSIDLERKSSQISRSVGEYINARVAELADQKQYDSKTRQIVLEELHRKVEGTFLWAALVCRELSKRGVQAIHVKEILQSLPSGLAGLYGRIMEQVNETENLALAAFAKTILRSVAIAFRPLSLSELAVTANLPFESRSKPRTLVQYVYQCGSFLTVRNETVYFVHGSAKDYLRAGLFSAGLNSAHRMVTTNLLSYVCDPTFSRQWKDVSKEEPATISGPNSCLEYPLIFWMDHGRHWSIDVAPKIDLTGEFFQHRSKLRDRWFDFYWAKRHHDEEQPADFTLLHLVAYSGLSWLATKSFLVEHINALDSLGALPLHWASRYGHTGLIVWMIDSGANIDKADRDGRLALHWAINGGHEAAVLKLLKNGATIDIVGKPSVSPVLHSSVKITNTAILCLLIHHGADVTTKDKSGRTALHCAGFFENISAIRVLLEKQASIEERDHNGNTSLHETASLGLHWAVKFLLEAGASHAVKNCEGRTPLHLAALFSGSEETIELLLKHGADVAAKDDKGSTALHYAGEIGFDNIVKMVLRNGANIATTDKEGRTALHSAAAAGKEAVLEFLLNEGADVAMNCKETGATALHLAARSGSLASVKTLLARGADVSMVDKSGKTVLHWAARSWDLKWELEWETELSRVECLKAGWVAAITEMVQCLLQAGADAKLRDREGCTAMHTAASSGNEAVVRVLAKIKALITTQDRTGRTPLHYAVTSGRVAIANMLLENGAWELLSAGEKNRLILHDFALHEPEIWLDPLAEKKGLEGLVRLLVEKGANIGEKEARGWTPLEIAVHERNANVIRLFLKLWPNENQNEMPLHRAIREGDDTEVNLLLTSGADMEKKDREGKNALHWAAIMGKKRVLQQLLDDNGSVVGEIDDEGRTALHCAASMKHYEVAQLLLERKVDISAKDGRGRTALHSATMFWGAEATAELLLRHGADIMARDHQGSTALHSTAQCDDRFTADVLLRTGADILAKDNLGRTALHLATSSGSSKMVMMLLERGSDVNAKEDTFGGTPLHVAQIHSDLTVVQQLLENGADISMRDNKGRTALHHAVAEKDIDKVCFLLEKGADVTAKDKQGSTAIRSALLEGCEVIARLLIEKSPQDLSRHLDGTELCLASSLGCKEIARLLFSRGADAAASDELGYQPLHHAAIENHEEVALFLLNHGANVSGGDSHGLTPLHLVVKTGNKKMSQLLIASGADVTAEDDEGRQPLHHATTRNQEGAVLLLLENGASISARDDQGFTPLHLATMLLSDTALLRLLLSKGADITAKDSRLKWNALHWAVLRGEREFVQLLLENGADIEARDKNGKTAMDVAVLGNKQAVAAILVEHTANIATEGDSRGNDEPESAVKWSSRWRRLFRPDTRK